MKEGGSSRGVYVDAGHSKLTSHYAAVEAQKDSCWDRAIVSFLCIVKTEHPTLIIFSLFFASAFLFHNELMNYCSFSQ